MLCTVFIPRSAVSVSLGFGLLTVELPSVAVAFKVGIWDVRRCHFGRGMGLEKHNQLFLRFSLEFGCLLLMCTPMKSVSQCSDARVELVTILPFAVLPIRYD